MQLHTFCEERGFLGFLQTHANATMRVLYVEPTGKNIPSYLPEGALTVCVDDILEAEYPKKHFTANHARKIAEYLLKACIDEVEFFIIYSTGNPYCLNGILKAIYKMFGKDKKQRRSWSSMLSAILSSWSILTVYTATRIFASCRPPARH